MSYACCHRVYHVLAVLRELCRDACVTLSHACWKCNEKPSPSKWAGCLLCRFHGFASQIQEYTGQMTRVLWRRSCAGKQNLQLEWVQRRLCVGVGCMWLSTLHGIICYYQLWLPRQCREIHSDDATTLSQDEITCDCIDVEWNMRIIKRLTLR